MTVIEIYAVFVLVVEIISQYSKNNQFVHLRQDKTRLGYIYIILLCFASNYNYVNSILKTHYFDGIHLNVCQLLLVMCGLFKIRKMCSIVESNLS